MLLFNYMKYILPKLGYQYDALEPYIDARTMEIHYSKHHQAYVDKLNIAVENKKELAEKDLDWLIKNLDKIPEEMRMAVRNNGGGHWNHSFFWQIMAKNSGQPEGKLLETINKNFGSLEKLKEEFNLAAVNRFGSGWAWLVADKGKLSIMSTANQDNPLMEGKQAILGLDVWEHAYYILYQNRRAEYAEQWWQVVNWKQVGDNYAKCV